MPGKGPPPKRESQRRRRNAGPPADHPTVTAEVRGPELGGEHTTLAVEFWDGLRRSGQAEFYEPSDWSVARLVVVAIDSFAAKPAAMMLSSINSMMSNLLVTEGDRRRVRLELERAEPEGDGADVSQFDDYKRRALKAIPS